MPQRMFITGSTGFVGSELVRALESGGHRVTRLVRSQQQAAQYQDAAVWQPNEERLDAIALEGADVVIHLAGENIAGRWTKKKKRAIRESRVVGTRTLARAIANLSRKPAVFICASAIGYYGNRGDEIVTESSTPGSDEEFLPRVCIEWEAACEPAREADIRVVNLRFGLILSPKGGALGKMLLPFKLGLGGVVGNGRQWWSWVSLEEVTRVVSFAIEQESLAGPVNVVTPEPVTNREFTKTLGYELHRFTVIPVPAFAARVVFGAEMANETLLSSTRALPRKLLDAGYQFTTPRLDQALRQVLG